MRKMNQMEKEIVKFFGQVAKFYGLMVGNRIGVGADYVVRYGWLGDPDTPSVDLGIDGKHLPEWQRGAFMSRDRGGMVSINSNYIYGEDVVRARGTVLHELTHAWCHEQDPIFFPLLMRATKAERENYWSPDNPVEEVARMAALGVDVRDKYLAIINNMDVRCAVLGGMEPDYRIIHRILHEEPLKMLPDWILTAIGV